MPIQTFIPKPRFIPNVKKSAAKVGDNTIPGPPPTPSNSSVPISLTPTTSPTPTPTPTPSTP